MGVPFLDDDDLSDLADMTEEAMPSDLHLQQPETATDGLGHTYATGNYTTQYAVGCRWRELSGNDLIVARSLAPTARGEVIFPLGTPFDTFQRFEILEDNVLQLAGRIVWADRGPYRSCERFYYEEVKLT